MRNATFSFLFLFCLFLSACMPVSKFPLSQPGEQPNDTRLTEVWLAVDEETGKVFKEGVGSWFFHISKDKEGWLEGVAVGPKSEGGLSLNTFEGFTSSIGGYHFLNIRKRTYFEKGVTGSRSEPDPKDGRYYIFLYELSEKRGELVVKEMSDKYVKKSIKEGRLEGFVEGDAEIITDSPANLILFIKESDIKKLFSGTFGVFRKWNGPGTPDKKSE